MSRRSNSAVLALTLVVAACGGGSASTSVAEAPTTQPAAAPTTPATDTTLSASDGPATTLAAGPSAGLPEDCADGLAEYFGEIEPVVAGFDPGSAMMGEFFRFDDAASDRTYELVSANDSQATYDCNAVGLSWAYFDSNSPWEAVIEVAAERAPGAVAYLEGVKAVSAIDVAVMTNYGVSTCEEAVAQIKQAVADQVAAGKETLAHMAFHDGLELFGLYNAYMAEVQDERCPRDELGNDEFDFMREYLPNG
ncbi:MAG: hypothetical protein ACT4OP_10760 [Actinomycetota bacterium]